MKATFRRLILASTILAAGAVPSFAQFDAPAVNFQGSVSVSAAARGAPVLPGGDAVVRGTNFDAGQTVTIWRGTSELTEGPLEVGEDGSFEWTFAVPADAAAGQHSLVVHAQNPSTSGVYNVKVSPDIALSGAENFEITSNKLNQGLYQVAYSETNDALFVAAAVGRPPISESTLMRIDPATLQITAEITPQPAPAREDGSDGGVYAVYGLGLDDSKNTVWITNTRQNTIAVYDQSDLSLIKQFEPGEVSHARDVLVDEERGFAYASATFTNVIAVVDTDRLEIVERIEIDSTRRGRNAPQFSATSLTLDEEAGKLFTTSLSTNEIAVIDLESREVEKVIPLDEGLSVIGIAYDHESGLAFVSAQDSDNLLIVDVDSGEVLHNVLVGAGALNVAFEPVGRLAYVSNRGAGTITVVSPEGEIVANLENGPFPNHLIADGKGTIYAVNKSTGADDEAGDLITRIEPR